jgi:hypothetical protein
MRSPRVLSPALVKGLHLLHLLLLLLPFLLVPVPSATANVVPFTLRYTADPAPLFYQGRTWVYTSHDLPGATYYNMHDYSLISTTDFVNFLDHGIVFDAASATWGPKGAWAQQVLGPVSGSDGKGGTCDEGFYMLWPNVMNHSTDPYCAEVNCGVGIALSCTGPAGPFVDITPNATPFLPGDDPTIFQDTSAPGMPVYACSNPGTGQAVCGQLASDMVSWAVAPRNITGTPHFFEAPWLMTLPTTGGVGANSSNSTYLLSYMCPARNESDGAVGHYGQDICVAACDPSQSDAPCPLGNYTFSPAQLLWNPPFDCGNTFGCSTGGGGNSHHGYVTPDGGITWYLFYHNHALGMQRGLSNIGLQRNIAVDAAYATGPSPSFPFPSFLPLSSTPNWLRQRSWVDAFTDPVPAALMSAASNGVDTLPSTDEQGNGTWPSIPAPPRMVVFVGGGVSWTKITGVDFGSPSPGMSQQISVSLRAYFALPPGGTGGAAFGAELLLDTLTPVTPPVVCPAPASGNASWTTIRCGVYGAPIVGVHDVYLRVDIPAGGVFNILWWQVTGGGAGKPSGQAPPPVQVQCPAMSAKSGALLGASTSGAGTGPITVGLQASPNALTLMRLLDNEDGTYAIMLEGAAATPAAYWCAADGSQGFAVTGAATSPTEACARFRLVGTTDGSYAISAFGSGMFVGVTSGGDGSGLAADVSDPRNATADSARFWLSACGDPMR